MKLFVFGLGFSAEYFVRTRQGDFDVVCGTVRTPERARALQSTLAKVDVTTFDDPTVPERLATADVLLVSVPPSQGSDPAIARYDQEIARSNIGRIVYLSTIGVYGGKNGLWIDEDAATIPSSTRGHARVEAENAWTALGARLGAPVFILRLAGIYGPGSNALENVRSGTAKRIVRPGQVFNRIHVEDIARAISAAISSQTDGGVFNVCDDEPSPPQDVIAYAAHLLGRAPPPEIAFDDADLSPMARTFWENNQRVSNRRLKETLGVKLRFPTYREGLSAIARES